MFAVAEDGDDGFFAGTELADLLLEAGAVVDRVQVDLLDDVTLDDAGVEGRTVFLDRGHVYAINLHQIGLSRDLRVHIGNADTQHRALHGAVLDEVIRHLADDVYRHGE